MATFFLIRHGSIDALGKRIVGRSRGVHLNAQGKDEVTWLAESLRRCEVAAIYSSPMERAQETASAIACKKGMAFTVDSGLNEIDYGEWTGKSFAELEEFPEWSAYNAQRNSARIPGGEGMLDLSRRVAETLQRVQAAHGEGSVFLVTHADWIRAAGAYVSGAGLDIFQRLDVDPASVSIVRLEGCVRRVVRWNVSADTSRSLLA